MHVEGEQQLPLPHTGGMGHVAGTQGQGWQRPTLVAEGLLRSLYAQQERICLTQG